MTRRVELAREAADEARAAHAWYLERNPDAAGRFLEQLRAAREQLAAHPKSAPVWSTDLRDRTVRKLTMPEFPCCLFYIELEDRVRVLAVAHTRRRPGYWQGRK